MQKKESYRHILPHFQQPGQAYFVTWNLKDAVPPKALARYSQQLELLKATIPCADPSGAAISNRDNMRLETASPELMHEYYSVRRKYIKAYDDLLDLDKNPPFNLSKPEITEILIQTLQFWEGKKLTNHTFTIMPNHIHWVLELFEKDSKGEPVYLQDILHSVKRFSSNRINKAENREGTLWQKESFETTIRDDNHLYYAIEYTLQNPVKAGLVNDWHQWKGSWCGCSGF
jgi:putative transposase